MQFYCIVPAHVFVAEIDAMVKSKSFHIWLSVDCGILNIFYCKWLLDLQLYNFKYIIEERGSLINSFVQLTLPDVAIGSDQLSMVRDLSRAVYFKLQLNDVEYDVKEASLTATAVRPSHLTAIQCLLYA